MWRQERDRYFTLLKNKIELMKRINGGNKVVLISHSYGTNVLLYFLKWAEVGARPITHPATGNRPAVAQGRKLTLSCFVMPVGAWRQGRVEVDGAAHLHGRQHRG